MKRNAKVLGLFCLGLVLYCLLVYYEHGYRLDWDRGIAYVPIVRPGMVEDAGLRITVDGATRNQDLVQGRVRLQPVRPRLGEPTQNSKSIALVVVFWGSDLAPPGEQAEGEPMQVCEMDGSAIETSIEFAPPEGATHFAIAAGPNRMTGKLPLPR